jgi:hypothetical protein
MSSAPDTFYAATIICTAEDAPTARQGGWEYHVAENPNYGLKPEQHQTVPLSPSGELPATHYVCTRHVSEREMVRIEEVQQARVAAGKARVPLTFYLSEKPVTPDRTLKAALAVHESGVLTELGLRRIAS